MKTRHLLSVLSILFLFQFSYAQVRKAADSELRLRLMKYVADNHLLPGETYIYWDSTAKKPVRFEAGSFLVADASEPLQKQDMNTAKPGTANNLLAGTGNFHLVKDINAAMDGAPAAPFYNSTAARPAYAVLNNVAYFLADDGIHGSELWRSDGTAAGTYLFKDIISGSASSSPVNLYVASGKLYFSIRDQQKQLWYALVSDGTEAPLVYLFPTTTGFANLPPGGYCSVDGSVFFTTTDYSSTKLWKTNGTQAGTTLVTDFDGSVGYVDDLTAQGNLLYFIANANGSGTQLYRSDGTDAGTFLVKNISHANSFNGPSLLTPYNGYLYFSADDGNGARLWVTNGTTDGTGLATFNNNVQLSNNGSIFSYTKPKMIVSNNILYFSGYTSATGWELYKYDASSGLGATVVKDLTPGSSDTSFVFDYGIAELNGAVYFMYYNSSGYHLYKTDGTDAGTVLVKDFSSLSTGTLYPVNGKLYFSVADVASSPYGEPWVSDGTTTGTVSLADIYTGTTGSSPYFFTACNDKTLFQATDSLHGAELYASSGSGAQLLKDINTTTTSSSYPYPMLPFKNGLLMAASSYTVGTEPYIATPTDANLLRDILPGGYSGNPQSLATKNGIGYFSALTDAVNNLYSIFKTDGTDAGTVKLIPDVKGTISGMGIADNGLVFYTYFNIATGTTQLWKTDGTVAGTLLLGSFNSISTAYNSSMRTSYVFTVAGNTVYFTANTTAAGTEIYKSNGTVQGTVLAADINPGAQSSNPSNLTLFNGAIYCNAYDGNGSGLQKIDTADNSILKLESGYISATVVSGNKLYFLITNIYFNNELWTTDGTVNGTSQVIVRYYPITSLTDANGSLYFVNYDSNTGSDQLWKSDGTSTGTQVLTSFTTDVSNYIDNLKAYNNNLFFTANSKLWLSDGSAANTEAITDKILDSSYISGLVVSGNTVFVNAYNYQYGSELYAGDAGALVLPVSLASFSASLKGNDVMSQWQTSSEINTAYFNVQRSRDGVHFTDIGTATAKGNSSTLQSYSFPDVNVVNLVSAKTLYYRLETVDKDGSISFSKTVAINLNLKEAVVLLLPNPVKDILKIRVNNYTGKAAIGVFDANGKNVYAVQQTIQNSADIIIRAATLPGGMYMVKVNLGGKMVQQKFFKE